MLTAVVILNSTSLRPAAEEIQAAKATTTHQQLAEMTEYKSENSSFKFLDVDKAV